MINFRHNTAGQGFRNSGFLPSLKYWIRIICITERIQLHTKYCCLLWKSGNPEKGYTQPKRLNLNQSLKSRLACAVCGVRNLKIQECV